MQRKVIVTGLGVVSPIGIGKSAFLESLRCGRSGIGGISLFDTSSYRYKLGAEVKDFCPDKYFGMKELRRMDRASQMALVAAQEAIEDSRLDFSKEDASRCGVVLGTTLGGMISGERYHR